MNSLIPLVEVVELARPQMSYEISMTPPAADAGMRHAARLMGERPANRGDLFPGNSQARFVTGFLLGVTRGLQFGFDPDKDVALLSWVVYGWAEMLERYRWTDTTRTICRVMDQALGDYVSAEFLSMMRLKYTDSLATAHMYGMLGNELVDYERQLRAMGAPSARDFLARRLGFGWSAP